MLASNAMSVSGIAADAPPLICGAKRVRAVATVGGATDPPLATSGNCTAKAVPVAGTLTKAPADCEVMPMTLLIAGTVVSWVSS
jgi:hypothetical protein